jgi:polysaccharide export outer membrane protein
MTVRLRSLVFLALALTLAACSSTWDQNPPTAAPGGVAALEDGSIVEGPDVVSDISRAPVVNETGAVPPYGSRGLAAAYEYGVGYRIGAGDRLTIRVVGQPDLTNDYLVDGAGAISFPLINTVVVAGMSADEAGKIIARRLRAGFLRNPEVTVQVTELRPFYILGEVNQAGSFPYRSGMTAQNAIAIAGGYGPRANQGKVLITRKLAAGTQSFQAPVTTQLYPGDIVYIRERWF